MGSLGPPSGQPDRRYEISVCPLCGEQVEVDDFYGDGHCPEHGLVDALSVEVQPIGPVTAKAWRVKNGLRSRWELTDPRTQNWGGNRTPPVLDEFDPEKVS